MKLLEEKHRVVTPDSSQQIVEAIDRLSDLDGVESELPNSMREGSAALKKQGRGSGDYGV